MVALLNFAFASQSCVDPCILIVRPEEARPHRMGICFIFSVRKEWRGEEGKDDV